MEIEFAQDDGGKVTLTPTPHLSINENISEINGPQKNGGEGPSLGDISMFNDGGNLVGKPPGSPERRPA